MPVYLDAIPNVAPKIKRPDTRRWLYLLGVMMLVGNALTFWLWTAQRTGFVFWFMASGLPFCLWGLMFSLRRFGYKCDQVWATSWDRERAQLLEQETMRGQRAAWVLNAGLITSLGSGPEKVLNAIKSATSPLNVQIPRAGGAPVRHARLAGFLDKQPSQDFEQTLNTLINQMKPTLENIPADIPCWLMVDCDVAGIPDADEKTSQILSSQTGKKLRLVKAKGVTAFDLWLDDVWQHPAVLIILSAVVRAVPQQDDGEAIAWLVLLNRCHPAFSNAVRLHRPEKGSVSSLSKTLERALLWCCLAGEEVKGAWTTGKALTQGGEWSLACEVSRLIFSMTEDNRDVDQTTGYTGSSAPWLAVILAATVTQQAGSQVVAAETGADEIWVVGVTTGDKTGIHRDLL